MDVPMSKVFAGDLKGLYLGELSRRHEMPTSDPDAAKQDQEQRATQSIEVGGRLLLALANSQTSLTLRDLSSPRRRSCSGLRFGLQVPSRSNAGRTSLS